MSTRIFTIGHSRRSFAALREALAAHAVATLVDIRRMPHSRMNPQFNREALAEALPSAGIAYLHVDALGGLRLGGAAGPSPNDGWSVAAFRAYADYAMTAPFRNALAGLCRRAAAEACAIMCAEADWRHCHRRIVSDHLIAHGFAVEHILDAAQSEPGELTSFAALRPDVGVVYPRPERRQRELPF